MTIKNCIKRKKRYFIRIPKKITVVHCDCRNFLYFSGPEGVKSLKVSVKVVLLSDYSVLYVSDAPCNAEVSHYTKKKIRMMRGSVLAGIKQILIEISGTLYQKLNLVGVGYRAFPHEHLPEQVYFKLGFSHLVYFNINPGLSLKINKFTKLYVYGSGSLELLTSTVSNIRDCKLPEPYKGKGILYNQEKITLKKGKKI